MTTYRTTLNRVLLEEVLKVLESCEAKLEYMGQHRVGTRDAPDCLHRAYKARAMMTEIRRVLDGR